MQKLILIALALTAFSSASFAKAKGLKGKVTDVKLGSGEVIDKSSSSAPNVAGRKKANQPCSYAGSSYPAGSTVTAGGESFYCNGRGTWL